MSDLKLLGVLYAGLIAVIIAFWVGQSGCQQCGTATQFLKGHLTERGIPAALLNIE